MFRYVDYLNGWKKGSAQVLTVIRMSRMNSESAEVLIADSGDEDTIQN